MAICLIIENPDQSREQAVEAIAHMRSTGPLPPDGARLVLGGPADPGWRLISVWDSEDQIERFFDERLKPTYAAVGLSLDSIKRTVFDVHAMAAGDLTGVPRPA
jgi:hypothetical protein